MKISLNKNIIMTLIALSNVSVRGIASCVPKNRIINNEYGLRFYDQESLAKSVKTIGIKERRVVPDNVTTSDLCLKAAEKLINELNLNKQEIDSIILVTQTPDYRIPATACILQNKLQLKKNVLAFDINLGCSGYVFGLHTAMSIIKENGIRNSLLLVGDTVSKFVSENDKASNLLFGDCGTATYIDYDKDNDDDILFSLNTDGSGYDNIIIPAGGYLNQSSIETLRNKNYDLKSIRNDEQIYLNGSEIFNFTIREIPKDVNKISSRINREIDYYIFHQANYFMLNYLRKKIKIDKDKFLLSIENFGNTSGASIPLTITECLSKNEAKYSGNLLLSGFGVGLSWGTCSLMLSECKILETIEYE